MKKKKEKIQEIKLTSPCCHGFLRAILIYCNTLLTVSVCMQWIIFLTPVLMCESLERLIGRCDEQLGRGLDDGASDEIDVRHKIQKIFKTSYFHHDQHCQCVDY